MSKVTFQDDLDKETVDRWRTMARDIAEYFMPRLSPPKCEIKLYCSGKADSDKAGSLIPMYDSENNIQCMYIMVNLFVSDSFEIIQTICHELVHFDQFNRGDLKIHTVYSDKYGRFEKDTASWKDDPVDMDYGEYQDRPWEAEAYSKDFDMAIEFVEKVMGIDCNREVG